MADAPSTPVLASHEALPTRRSREWLLVGGIVAAGAVALAGAALLLDVAHIFVEGSVKTVLTIGLLGGLGLLHRTLRLRWHKWLAGDSEASGGDA